jgi:hypothetical protein
VYLEVNPVGKPDAVVPHVRFDERRWETELWYGLRHRRLAKAAGNGYSPYPKATAPIFDSTGYPYINITSILLDRKASFSVIKVSSFLTK